MNSPIVCSVLVLSYNGLSHLQHLLPTIEEAISACDGISFDVKIIENGKGDGSETYVRNNHTSFDYVYAATNDYLFTYNAIIESLNSDYIFLLNNDLKLDKDIFSLTIPLIHQDPELFAISSTILSWEGDQVQESVKSISLSSGWLYIKNESHDPEQIRYTFNACGGASIYRTSYFKQLKGFDRLYYPAYYEDTDLSHRAWQKGWKVINHPKAIVYHREGASWNKSGDSRRTIMIYRNKILGILKNSRQRHFIFQFFFRLPYRIIVGISNDKRLFKAFLSAFIRFPKAIKKRLTSKKVFMDDYKIAKYLNEEYQKK